MGARLHQVHGQASVETLMLLIMAVGVLVVMMVYVQRAYNGYLYASASSHGVPYDPTRSRTVVRQLDLRQTQVIHVKAGPKLKLPTGGDELTSLKGGAVSGRIHTTTASVTNNWDFCSRSALGTGAALPTGCPDRASLGVGE